MKHCCKRIWIWTSTISSFTSGRYEQWKPSSKAEADRKGKVKVVKAKEKDGLVAVEDVNIILKNSSKSRPGHNNIVRVDKV